MGNSVLITRHTLADPLKAITDYLSELTGIGIKVFLSLKKRISYGFGLNFNNPQSQLSMELTLSSILQNSSIQAAKRAIETDSAHVSRRH